MAGCVSVVIFVDSVCWYFTCAMLVNARSFKMLTIGCHSNEHLHFHRSSLGPRQGDSAAEKGGLTLPLHFHCHSSQYLIPFTMRYKSGGRPLYYETRYIIKHYDMVLRKDELEVQLKDEHQLIRDGKLRDDSPLDVSEEFGKLCDACRVGDLKGCQEAITTGVNINARDYFDYTPLILVSLT
jgi:hypothetical protein